MTTWSRYFTSQFRRALNKLTLADMWTLFQQMPAPLRSQMEASLKGSPEGLALRFLQEQPRLRAREMGQSFWPRELIDALNIPETLPPLPPGVMSQLTIQHKVTARSQTQQAPAQESTPTRNDVMLNVLSLLDLKLEERGPTIQTSIQSLASQPSEIKTQTPVVKRPEIGKLRLHAS